MKMLRIVVLGVAIWGLSLLWPEINQSLTEPMTVKAILGLSVIIGAYIIAQHLDWRHPYHNPGQNHPSRPLSTIGNYIQPPQIRPRNQVFRG